MKPFKNANVAEVFKSYPANVRSKLVALRALIFKTAAATEGVGEIEETLKWGEPAYVTSKSKSGSTIRLGWKPSSPTHYAMYFNCQTNLIETFKTMFPVEFIFEGNRAIIFNELEDPATDSLSFCIAVALTYHRNKSSAKHSKPTRP